MAVTSRCYRLSKNISHAAVVDAAIAAVEVCTFVVWRFYVCEVLGADERTVLLKSVQEFPHNCTE
jgi:hypothetical protein